MASQELANEPEGHRQHFAERLLSRDNGTHHAALDELFVHHMLQDGREVRYEEGGRGPDFRTYRQGRDESAIEVVSLFQREDWEKEDRQHGQIADALNALLAPSRYRVSFEVALSERTPSAKRLATWVKRQIADLQDPALVAKSRRGIGSSGLPQASYEDKGVVLHFTFWPVPPDTQGRGITADRIVAMGPHDRRMGELRPATEGPAK